MITKHLHILLNYTSQSVLYKQQSENRNAERKVKKLFVDFSGKHVCSRVSKK
jgi:hypothetical protein